MYIHVRIGLKPVTTCSHGCPRKWRHDMLDDTREARPEMTEVIAYMAHHVCETP